MKSKFKFCTIIAFAILINSCCKCHLHFNPYLKESYLIEKYKPYLFTDLFELLLPVTIIQDDTVVGIVVADITIIDKLISKGIVSEMSGVNKNDTLRLEQEPELINKLASWPYADPRFIEIEKVNQFVLPINYLEKGRCDTKYDCLYYIKDYFTKDEKCLIIHYEFKRRRYYYWNSEVGGHFLFRMRE